MLLKSIAVSIVFFLPICQSSNFTGLVKEVQAISEEFQAISKEFQALKDQIAHVHPEEKMCGDNGGTLWKNNGQVHISKGQILNVFPVWGLNYKVEADITIKEVPTETWISIFHFTIGENNANYGDRIPAVWIHRDGYYYIGTALDDKKNFAKQFHFTKGKKHHMVIHQYPENDQVIYKIAIDGDVIFSQVNNKPQNFNDVKLYVSNPWRNSFDVKYGLLENLNVFKDCDKRKFIQHKCSKTWESNGQVHINKGQILNVFPKWGLHYKVEADITVNELPSEQWTNIFHFTIGEDVANYGDRIPAVWIGNDGYVHICTALNDIKDFCRLYSPRYFTKGKKHHITIHQYPENDDVIYSIELDGDVIFSQVNNKPKNFNDVKLYVSNPWHNSFDTRYGMLENLQALQGCE